MTPRDHFRHLRRLERRAWIHLTLSALSALAWVLWLGWAVWI